ncbi:CARDB domain-containing protein [Aquimarina agarivorans]|uniref:CARDB domain-containing protein n=1 Tax=Aquimarina agarivorans TaxID=980584 RepID=UPI000248F017|nr:CARDB domain-containing protein [Aquimarina agarivorans]
MKKLLSLLIALTSISIAFGQELNIKNLKINASRSKTFKQFERFDYQFEIKGTYSSVGLFLYYERISPETSIGVQYWNEDRDNNLVFTNYEVHKTWSPIWSNITVSIPGKKFYLVAKYKGIEKVLTYTAPGRTNPTLSGEPKLTLDKNQTTVFSDCSSCSSVNDRHSLRGFISSFNISASIRNTGNAASNNTTLKFYGSRDTKLDNGDKNAFRDVRISSLRPNNVGGGSVTISASDIIFDTFTPGNYNLLFVIDGKVIGSVPFRFSATASGFKTLSSLEEKNKPKELKIFDLTGRIILEKTINSKEDEEETIKNELNAGLYIIRSGTNVYKLYKE